MKRATRFPGLDVHAETIAIAVAEPGRGGEVKDQLRARHRMSKFLLRAGRRPSDDVKAWSAGYVTWLRGLRFEHAARRATMVDYLAEVDHMAERIRRLEQAIDDAVKTAPEELLELALDESRMAEAVLRMIARGVEQRRDMILHDAIEHGVFRLAAGIATRRGRSGMGVVDGKHGRRAEQAPCHVPAQTIAVGWKFDLPGGVRRLDVPPRKCPDPGQDISARSGVDRIAVVRRTLSG